MRGSINEMAAASSLHVATPTGRVRPVGVEPGALSTRRLRLVIGALALVVLAALASEVYSRVGARSLAADQTVLPLLSITYDRRMVSDLVFVGPAKGDLAGRWVVTLVSGVNSPEVFNGELYWAFIGADPSQSFVARLKGTHDHRTNETSYDGTIVDGYMLGARVEDRGRLRAHATAAMQIVGTIQIFPAETGSGR